MIRWILVLALLVAPLEALASACTDTVDCLCDCYANTDGIGNDVQGGTYANANCSNKGVPIRSNVIGCEDWDSPALTATVGSQNWTDTNGQSGWRGNGSYWMRNYSTDFGSGTCDSGEQCAPTDPYPMWLEGQPNPATYGATCTIAGGCFYPCEWTGANQFQCRDLMGWIDIKSSPGDFTAEDAGLGVPDCGITTNDNCGVWDGNNSWAYRIPLGDDTTDRDATGASGYMQFRTGGVLTKHDSIGVTFMLAYDDRAGGVGVVHANEQAWKHEEWTNGGAAGGSENLIGNTSNAAICVGGSAPGTECFDSGTCPGGGSCSYGQNPFKANLDFSDASVASCTSVCNAATKTKGTCRCFDAGGGYAYFSYTASQDYTRSSQFPYGKWGCVRYQFVDTDGSGGADGSIQMWLGSSQTAGGTVTEVQTLDISGIDFTGHLHEGWNSFLWNAYANQNQGGGTATTVLSERYMDNYVITDGVPVTCSEISGGAAPLPIPHKGGSRRGGGRGSAFLDDPLGAWQRYVAKLLH